jgi:hypothetical protein
MEPRPTLMQSPHVPAARPLMAAGEQHRASRPRTAAPPVPELTALLWCYAAAAAFALALAHAAT